MFEGSRKKRLGLDYHHIPRNMAELEVAVEEAKEHDIAPTLILDRSQEVSITEEREVTSSHDLLMTKKNIHIADMEDQTKYVSTRFHSP